MNRQINEKVEHFEGEGEQYFSKQAKCGWCELVCKFVKTKFNRLKTKYVFLCNLYYISFSRINQMIRQINEKVEHFEGEGEQYFSKQAKCGWCQLVCKLLKLNLIG